MRISGIQNLVNSSPPEERKVSVERSESEPIKAEESDNKSSMTDNSTKNVNENNERETINKSLFWKCLTASNQSSVRRAPIFLKKDPQIAYSTNSEGKSALSIAFKRGQKEIIQALFEAMQLTEGTLSNDDVWLERAYKGNCSFDECSFNVLPIKKKQNIYLTT